MSDWLVLFWNLLSAEPGDGEEVAEGEAEEGEGGVVKEGEDGLLTKGLGEDTTGVLTGVTAGLAAAAAAGGVEATGEAEATFFLLPHVVQNRTAGPMACPFSHTSPPADAVGDGVVATGEPNLKNKKQRH